MQWSNSMGAKPSCILYNPTDYINTSKNDLVLTPQMYPMFGLYHSLDTLTSKWPGIIGDDIVEQSKYSDAITRRYALNPHFRYDQMIAQKNLTSRELAIVIKSGFNTTAIGNMAFMAIQNGRDSEEEKRYNEVMNILTSE